MREQWRIEVVLTLLGPILTRGGRTIGPGIDAPIARDGHNRPMLPFSLIKGKVRDAFRQLGQLGAGVVAKGQILDWLGDPSSDFPPATGRLSFGDLATETQPVRDASTDGVIRRIAIDQEAGSASEQMLAMIEAPFGYGQPVEFRGTIEFVAERSEAQVIQAAVERALRWTPSYGAMRTVGFGRTKDVRTTLVPSPPRSSGAPVVSGVSVPVRYRFDRPLCLVGRKHSRNHFESLASVPGAVLKGALARLILELSGSTAKAVDPSLAGTPWPTLVNHFEGLRFTEARPMTVDAKVRPVEPPLSIAVYPDGTVMDLAREDQPPLIQGAAPAFAPDWNDEDHGKVRAAFGWSEPPRERRTRTAIDPEKGRAKDEMLFSYGLVRPEEIGDDGRLSTFVWEGAIGLEHVPAAERTPVLTELAMLLKRGLPNVGKTRAIATVDWLAAPTPAAVGPSPSAGSTNLHVVTLQTEFLMTDPVTLKPGRPEDLKRAYEDFWRDASGGSMRLERYFARQVPHGGYLSMRSGRKTYKPFLVTERGSAFVLEATDPAKAAHLLKTWGETGLPAPSWIATQYGQPNQPLWKCCPFLPHAGFGEVAIDLECPCSPTA